MIYKRCLICCGESFPKKIGTQEANSTSFPSAEIFNGQQAEGNDDGRDIELQILFLIRKLLEIPEDTCCKLREHFGKASLWIECCDSCLDLVEKCKAALEQAELFQKQYEELRSNIKTTMLKSPKKPFSAESKCEAIVRSHLITQEIDNFIKTTVSEADEELIPDRQSNFDQNNSSASVGCQDSEDSQVLVECGSITPVLIDRSYAVQSEEEIIISFKTESENFINTLENEEDTEIYPNGNANFDSNNLVAPLGSQDTAEVLPGPITSTLSEVKSEDGTAISLNVNDDMDCNLESSDFGNNIQSVNTFDCEENHYEAIQSSDKPSKSANDNLEQFIVFPETNESSWESKFLANPTEEEEPGEVSKKCDKGDAEKKHECHICLQLFKLPEELRNHMSSHSSTETAKNIVKKRKGSFRKRPTKLLTAKKHKCDICGKPFTRPRNLNIHRRIHSSEKPFECHICGKGFIDAFSLKVHCKGHSGAKPFECPVCGKAFLRKPDLKEHQTMSHSQKKPFKCDVCDASFKLKKYLSRHCKIHDKKIS